MGEPFLSVSVEGLPEMQRALAKMAPENNAAILSDALVEAGFRVQRSATTDFMLRGGRSAPIDSTLLTIRTGQLVRSVGVDRSGLPKNVTIGSDLIYAPVHELGSKKRDTPARPYLAPALKAVQKQFPEILLRSFRRNARIGR